MYIILVQSERDRERERERDRKRDGRETERLKEISPTSYVPFTSVTTSYTILLYIYSLYILYTYLVGIEYFLSFPHLYILVSLL